VIQFGCCFSKTIFREIVYLASLEKHRNEISEYWQKRTNDGLRGEVFDELQTINLKNVGPMSQDESSVTQRHKSILVFIKLNAFDLIWLYTNSGLSQHIHIVLVVTIWFVILNRVGRVILMSKSWILLSSKR